MPDFQFIDNNATSDQRCRKLIRSHVMKGKNVGKTAAHRGWKGRTRNEDAPPKRPDETEVDIIPTLFNPFAGTEFNYLNAVTRMTAPMRSMVLQFHRNVISHIYPELFCLPQEQSRFPWFQTILTNEAHLHTLYFMTSSYLVVLRGEHGTEDPALTALITRHYVHTLRLVKKALAASDRPSFSTFAMVVSLVTHANLRGDVKESRIHSDGLKHLIATAPGGISYLDDQDPALVHKICRADVEASLREGTVTHFGSSMTVMRCIARGRTILGTNGRTHPRGPGALAHASPYLKHVAADVLALCRRAQVEELKVSGYEFQDILMSVFYRLLDVAPISDSHALPALDRMWQLGLSACMVTISHSSSNHRALFSDVLASGLCSCLNDESFFQGDELRKFHLWLFFMYYFLTPELTDLRWLRVKVRQICAVQGLESWGDIVKVLQKFPWVEELHDATGRYLWLETEPMPIKVTSRQLLEPRPV